MRAGRTARAAAGAARRYDKFSRPIKDSDRAAVAAADRADLAVDEAYEQRQTAAAALVKAKGIYRDSLRSWHRSMAIAAAKKNGKRKR
jgi:hypothetical protein